ncbi:MAG: hypothetical protein R3290_04825 [Acidimicrobiia bacterium]|nr:hypothetical protein [Acidimicrobiia bacterium]
MKSVTEMRETAEKTGKAVFEQAQKAAYAVVGAPAVATKRAMEYGTKLSDTARKEFEAWATEGERLADQLRERATIDELRERVDFDQLQGRVEKLRDQLEDVLANWRDNFVPESEKPAEKAAPAKKATTAKKPAAKTTTKKSTASKASTTKKTTAKSSTKSGS